MSLSRVAERTLVTFVCVQALSACNSPLLTPPPSVGFRLIVDNGVATLTGRVVMPASLLSRTPSLYSAQAVTTPAAPTLELNELPAGSATIDLVDNKGQVKADSVAVTTDSDGWFVLGGARIGEAAFVRARFQGQDGKPHTAFTFVRPAGAAECVSVSLPTTLVAQAIARKDNLYPVFDPEKLEPIYTQVRTNLPATLAGLAPGATFGTGTTTTPDPAAIQQVLEQATESSSPAGAEHPLPAFDTFFDQVLGPVQSAIDQATDTFLQVSFSIQALGVNKVVPRDLDAARHMLIGQAEVLCEAPDDSIARLSFWLNNESIGSGVANGRSWNTRVDSRKYKDGPYVLTAIATPKDPKAQAILTKAFLYVRNATPEAGHGGCNPAAALKL